ncbi:hypothetical protein B0H12DRAFT_1329653 [Mycena haematopus]|nr:hypothetical protein B0H12DRAFT_1329653 [Mycena haematopus]
MSFLALTYIPEVTGLQQNTSNTGGAAVNIATLTLVHWYTSAPAKLLQDNADASTLSGIAKLGGFWTFVNGVFTLVFDANIIYFAFGKSRRRPLSALGMAHLFQRGALAPKWNKDFPAIHSEGGLPSAGIVAFIREL